MIATGNDRIDADHAALMGALQRGIDRLVVRDASGAAESCEHGLALAGSHWSREAELLSQTGWSASIIRCHLDDHEAIEASLAAALAALHRGVAIDPAEARALRDRFLEHVATFDLPLIERLRRRAEGGA